MQPQGVYNLQIQEEENRGRRARVGLLHQRTGVPVFLLYLDSVESAKQFELFSMEDAETLRFKSASDHDRKAWELVKSFFESEGQHAHVVASPFDSGDALGSMLGVDRGLDHRTGLHCLRGYVENADLVVVPQASLLLEAKQHRGFFDALFKLNTELDHYFILVDLPKHFQFGDVTAWKKGLNQPNAAVYFPWLLVDGHILPPAAVAAAAIQRNDVQNGIQDSPANRPLAGPYKPLLQFSPAELALYNDAQVNVFHVFEKDDVRVWGSYTLTDRLDFDNRHIATRRSVLALREAINQICEPFVLEPLVADLAHTIEVSLHSFFQDHKKLLDSNARQAFKAEVSVDNRAGDDVVVVDLQLSLPYVVNQMTLSMALTG